MLISRIGFMGFLFLRVSVALIRMSDDDDCQIVKYIKTVVRTSWTSVLRYPRVVGKDKPIESVQLSHNYLQSPSIQTHGPICCWVMRGIFRARGLPFFERRGWRKIGGGEGFAGGGELGDSLC